MSIGAWLVFTEQGEVYRWRKTETAKCLKKSRPPPSWRAPHEGWKMWGAELKRRRRRGEHPETEARLQCQGNGRLNTHEDDKFTSINWYLSPSPGSSFIRVVHVILRRYKILTHIYNFIIILFYNYFFYIFIIIFVYA